MIEPNEIQTTYDQRWQSTIKELVAQREQHQREILALHARLTAAAKQLVWYNCVGALPFALVLLCFGYIFFARPAPKSPVMFKVPSAFDQAEVDKSSTAPLARKRIRCSTSKLEQADMGSSIDATAAHRMRDNRRVRLELPMSLSDMDDEDDPADSPDDDLVMDIND